MGIDVVLMRRERGGDPEKVARSQAARGLNPDVVHLAVQLDVQLRGKRLAWERSVQNCK